MHLTSTVQQNIAFAVQSLSKCLHKPSDLLRKVEKQVLRKLKGTAYFSTCFRSERDEVLTAGCDADYAQEVPSQKSICATVVMIAGGIASWRSKQQTRVA